MVEAHVCMTMSRYYGQRTRQIPRQRRTRQRKPPAMRSPCSCMSANRRHGRWRPAITLRGPRKKMSEAHAKGNGNADPRSPDHTHAPGSSWREVRSVEPVGNLTPDGNSHTRSFDPPKLPLGHSQTKFIVDGGTLCVNPVKHCGVQVSPDSLPAQLAYDAPITALVTCLTST